LLSHGLAYDFIS